VGERKPAPPRPIELNISGGGLRFETERHFQQGESLAITLVLPGIPTIRTQAEVVYYLPPERKGSAQHPVAVRFTTITDKEREAIVRYVAQLQVERPSVSGRKK
jgi:c-di-GMP-binding flagellar brake protein YcgR